MPKILISACLLGNPVRYNGKGLPIKSKLIEKWRRENRMIPFCPEVSAGLPVPRPPAEIVGGDGSAVIKGIAVVRDQTGNDVSSAFIKGAYQALEVCRKYEIKVVVLTESSPSCGGSQIYDGGFSGLKIPGGGVTAALLIKNNIRVFNQYSIQAAGQYLNVRYVEHDR